MESSAFYTGRARAMSTSCVRKAEAWHHIMAHPFAGLALHTWTLDTTPLADALAAAKEAGFDAVELRRIDFRRAYEQDRTNEQVLDLVRASGLKVSAVGVEYGWMFAQSEESTRLFGVFREQCQSAVALGCGLMMSALGPGAGTVSDAVESVRKAGDLAGEFGLRLTLEFQFQHPIVNTLDLLRNIIARAGRSNVGLLLDAYHLQRAGRSFDGVPAHEIFYFQYSDVPDAPPNAAPPTDRLPPGKGVINWIEVLRLLAKKDYRGYLSFEAPNPEAWARPAVDAAREGVEATRRVLAAAF
jgi:2-keto-myo-inositol isomerase